MSHLFEHTCAAISTAKGKAGIAVIRMSGKDSVDIASRVFFPRSGKSLYDAPHAKAVFGDIYYSGDIIDNGLCTVFYAPNSYTGDNTVEISCHGSELGAALVLSALVKEGAKPAQPGEFTKRAFLNGKINLTQAEAVGDLLEAKSPAALRLSAAKVDGKLGTEIESIRETLVNILSSVYAFIDYPDEDLADMSVDQMREQLTHARERLSSLCASYNSGRAVSQGIRTSIVGLPNSGKSSLLNMLLCKDRAIVTDIAGTTRDIITESVTLGNITLLVSDTAGIRHTQDAVEKIGVEKAFESIKEAELIFLVLDSSSKLSGEEESLLRELAKEQNSNKNVIVLLNKNDMDKYSEDKKNKAAEYGFTRTISVCAKNSVGTEDIKTALNEIYPAGDELIKSGLVVTGARIYAALNNAYEALCDGIAALDSYTQDIAGMDIERAVAALGEADGREVTEDIVNNIFTHFCVGK